MNYYVRNEFIRENPRTMDFTAPSTRRATTLCWARSIVIGTELYAHPKSQLKSTPKSLFVARRDDVDELRNEITAKGALPPPGELYRTKSCVDSTTAKKTRTCVRTVQATGKCSSVRIIARAAATENTVGLFGRSGGNEMVARRTQWPHFLGTLNFFSTTRTLSKEPLHYIESQR